MNQPSLLKSAAIPGLLFGLVSAIPIVGALNCACCALVVAAGFTAAYLHSQACAKVAAGFTAGTGALAGFGAGMFHAISVSVFSTLVSLVIGGFDPAKMREMLQQLGGSMDPQQMEAVEQVLRSMEGGGPLIAFLFSLLAFLIAGAIFGTLGGLIGGAVFKREG
jgi:hypothetical protein